MPTRFLWALAFVFVISIIMSRQNRRQRQSAWAGVVKEIRHQRPSITRDEDRSGDDWVTVLYQTDEGKNGKLKLRMASVRQFFPDIRVGDRLVKQPGDYLPCRPKPELPETAAGETATAEQANLS